MTFRPHRRSWPDCRRRRLYRTGFSKEFPVVSDTQGDRMKALIAENEPKGPVGGIAECVVTSLPVGLGDPIFDGMENRIAQIVSAAPRWNRIRRRVRSRPPDRRPKQRPVHRRKRKNHNLNQQRGDPGRDHQRHAVFVPRLNRLLIAQPHKGRDLSARSPSRTRDVDLIVAGRHRSSKPRRPSPLRRFLAAGLK